MTTINGVEIFATGIWNDHKVTVEDLVMMARNQQTLSSKLRVPLKFGHNDEQPMTDGQPALGWVTRLRIVKNKLLADFEQVPDLVHQIIKAGRYDRVSAEVLFGVEVGDEEIGTVLVGVALLGADLPAVSDLDGLSKLVASLQVLPGDVAHISFSVGDDINRFQLKDHEGAIKTSNEDIDMDEIKALNAKLESLSASMDAIKDNADKESKRADEATKELEGFKQRQREEVDKANAELFTASRRTIIDECERLVKDRKMQPALRDKIATAVDAGQGKFSDNGKAILFDSELVMELVKSFAGELPEGELGEGAGQDQGKGDDDKVPADIQLEAEVKKYAVENSLDMKNPNDLQAAHSAVLNANPKLAKAYYEFNSTITAN